MYADFIVQWNTIIHETSVWNSNTFGEFYEFFCGLEKACFGGLTKEQLRAKRKGFRAEGIGFHADKLGGKGYSIVGVGPTCEVNKYLVSRTCDGIVYSVRVKCTEKCAMLVNDCLLLYIAKSKNFAPSVFENKFHFGLETLLCIGFDRLAIALAHIQICLYSPDEAPRYGVLYSQKISPHFIGEATEKMEAPICPRCNRSVWRKSIAEKRRRKYFKFSGRFEFVCRSCQGILRVNPNATVQVRRFLK